MTDRDMTPAPGSGVFTNLVVEAVAELTAEARLLTLTVPAGSEERFAFIPGQHLTVTAEIDGQHVRRSYSICAGLGDGKLQIAVRKVPEGQLSTHLVDRVVAGDEIGALPPTGRFGIEPARGTERRYAAVAAGSGITPILSIMRSVLAIEERSEFLLVYGNRDAQSVMFADEIAELKDTYGSRLQVFHLLSRERRGIDVLDGRITRERLDDIMGAFGDASSIDKWFLCGPLTLVEDLRRRLTELGVGRSSVHTELFFTGQAPARPNARTDRTAHRLLVRLSGRESVIETDSSEFVLDAVLRARTDAPYACKGGVCGTCRALVVEGEVELTGNYALEESELDAGYVLTCRSVMRTHEARIDYDA